MESNAIEVSFEWSNHCISSTNSKVRTTLNVSITDSGSERVRQLKEVDRADNRTQPIRIVICIKPGVFPAGDHGNFFQSSNTSVVNQACLGPYVGWGGGGGGGGGYGYG